MAELAGDAAVLTRPGDVPGLAAALEAFLAEGSHWSADRAWPWRRRGRGSEHVARHLKVPTPWPANPGTRVPTGSRAHHRRQGSSATGWPRTWPGPAMTSWPSTSRTDVADGAAVRRGHGRGAARRRLPLGRPHARGEAGRPEPSAPGQRVGTAEILAAARAQTSAPGSWWSARPRSTASSTPSSCPARGRPDPPRQSVRGEQAGRRGGGAPGLAGLRPAGHRGAPVQPHRPRAVAELLRAGVGQADRRGPAVRGVLPAGGDADHAARLHRRTRRRGGLPAPDRAGEPGQRLQRLLWSRHLHVGGGHRLLDLAGARLDLETDPALVRPVDVPVLRGDAARLRGPPGGSRRSRWPRRSPMSWRSAEGEAPG